MSSLALKSPSNFKAALWMAGWLSMMLAVMVAARESSREIHAFQIMEMRSVLGLIMVLPLVWMQGGMRSMATARLPLHIARNSVHYVGQLLWFLALTMIPLSQLVAIEFTMPIWAALLAVYFLGERMNMPKIFSIVCGVAGVLLIVRPIGSDINVGQISVLVAAVGFGASVVMVKTLTHTETTLKILFWMTVIQSVIGIIPGTMVWVWPSFTVWCWMLLVGFAGTFSHFCMARAMLYADTMIVVPLDFLRLPLSVLIGWLVYSEALDIYTAFGAALILLGNVFNLKAPRSAAAR